MITIVMACYGNLEKSKMSYKSVIENTDVPFKFIIIEQNSPDGSREWAKSIDNKNVHVCLSEENKGLIYARNYGIDNIHPETKYIMFFDNDIYAPKNWASRMVGFMDHYKEVGISGPASNFAGTPQLVQYSDEIKFGDKDQVDRIEQRSQSLRKRVPAFNYAPISWPVVGFAFFVRREVIEQVGYFDSNIPGEWDDTDYCRSAEKFNWRLAYINNIYIHHWGHASKTVMGNQYTYENQESSKEYIKKKWGWI